MSGLDIKMTNGSTAARHSAATCFLVQTFLLVLILINHVNGNIYGTFHAIVTRSPNAPAKHLGIHDMQEGLFSILKCLSRAPIPSLLLSQVTNATIRSFKANFFFYFSTTYNNTPYSYETLRKTNRLSQIGFSVRMIC